MISLGETFPIEQPSFLILQSVCVIERNIALPNFHRLIQINLNLSVSGTKFRVNFEIIKVEVECDSCG